MIDWMNKSKAAEWNGIMYNMMSEKLIPQYSGIRSPVRSCSFSYKMLPIEADVQRIVHVDNATRTQINNDHEIVSEILPLDYPYRPIRSEA